MLEVYHYPLCPYSRKLRIILKEKNLEFELFPEKYWERRKGFLKMNPAGDTPVIVKQGGKVFSGNNSIFEYLEETANDNKLVPGSPEEKAEIRRITEWFDIKFYDEVTRYLYGEKVLKVLSKQGHTNSKAIRAAKKNILYHLDYIAYLLGDNQYLCGEEPTVADFAAAAQLSVLDFLGDVPWKHNVRAKEWYALIKSRPSFKPILMDKVPGFHPPIHYGDPDF